MRFHRGVRARWVLGGLLGLLSALVLPQARAAHAYAQFGDIRYPPGFKHWSYVRPDAPRGGEIELVPPTRISNFDKFNPFTLKGTAPPGLSALVFESLLVGNFDEPTTSYGLLAEDVEAAPDRRSVTFTLNALARFQNGDPVRAEDVRGSFERLTGPKAAPQWRSLLAEVSAATVLDARRIRFEFKGPSAELPLIVGAMPVFSHKWGEGKDFDQVVLDPPIGSGPYRVGPYRLGRDIQYQRDAAYWGRDLPVRVGQYNFDRIGYKIYKDNTAQLEAFKAGEFDVIQAFIAREWARQYAGPKFERGELTKRELAHGNAGDFQGFLINTRRERFADARVRRALALAMDFEWMNRQLFYGAYTRVRGYFPNSDFEARGRAEGDELTLLRAVQRKVGMRELPDAVIEEPVPLPPSTEAPRSLRENLREARALLAAAGWTPQDGQLRNAKGESFTIEFLDNSGSMGRVVTPYAQNLAKLGIQVSTRVVDFALLQKRVDVFDFDIISQRILGSEAPGSELVDRYGSKAAEVEGSSNVTGIRSPAVDALLESALAARTRPELVARLCALDRVLRHGHYVIPHWLSSVHRLAWRAGRFAQPATLPRYYQPENWVVQTWWSEAAASDPSGR